MLNYSLGTEHKVGLIERRKVKNGEQVDGVKENMFLQASVSGYKSLLSKLQSGPYRLTKFQPDMRYICPVYIISIRPSLIVLLSNPVRLKQIQSYHTTVFNTSIISKRGLPKRKGQLTNLQIIVRPGTIP